MAVDDSLGDLMAMMRRGQTARPKASAYDKALALLARREHSEAELQRKLGQAGYPLAEIQAALARLTEAHYQDDARFGEALLRSRVRQGYGPVRIRVELRSHGLSEPAIAELLAAADQDWSALAQQQLQRYVAGRGRSDEPAERQRRMQYLQRRGFSGAQIRRADRDLADAATDEDGWDAL